MGHKLCPFLSYALVALRKTARPCLFCVHINPQPYSWLIITSTFYFLALKYFCNHRGKAQASLIPAVCPTAALSSFLDKVFKASPS